MSNSMPENMRNELKEFEKELPKKTRDDLERSLSRSELLKELEKLKNE